ncbi:PREDICTED: uncharacterized protein LOC105562638, partial [Vollenhovia emeryi]|uniref:uncharacterized protein LOC105562638 n=1 Tax=Vollenhovia emeryi TaxID=411798 RepID=UPI0005F4C33D
QRTSLDAFNNIDRSRWLVNLSKRQIPDSVLSFLSLGENFGIPVCPSNKKDRFCSVLETIKSFENNIYKIPTNAVNTIRNAVTTSLHKFISNKPHHSSIDRHILIEHKKCKKFLHDNKDLFVTKADKGQVTVVMDRLDYTNKMNTLLSDQSTYKCIKKDPIKQLSTKINTLVKSWLDNGIIDDRTYQNLRSTNGNLPRCYGLPKIHKTGHPLRIIVSALGSPIYNVASFLHEILQKSIQKPASHIKDSWALVEAIKNKPISDNELLISLDVNALFTNIPKDLVFKAIEKRWQKISEVTFFTLPQFLHAIETVLDSTSFSFNGVIYEQIFGSPMGSPLSPILADIVLDDLESQCLLSLGFDLPTYYRYVDDVLTIIPDDKIDLVLTIFNSYHPRLKFTYEIENDKSINFLDTSIIRQNGKLLTNWYRKPTFSGRYINFFSSHPLNYKINTIINLVDHAILLSDEQFHSSNMTLVKEILTNNGFPTQ